MKTVLVLASAFLFSVCSASAQVSCSPSANADMCRDASGFFPVGIRIPIEIVTPVEYKSRLADFDRREESMSSDPDKDGGRSVIDVEHFTIFHKHVLFQTYADTISFLRDRPSDKTPSRILVSSEVFESKVFKTIDGKSVLVSTGEYDRTSLGQFFAFASGFIQGTMATFKDGGSRMDQLLKVVDRDKPK